MSCFIFVNDFLHYLATVDKGYCCPVSTHYYDLIDNVNTASN